MSTIMNRTSKISQPPDPISAERWNVRVAKRNLDSELEIFYKQQTDRLARLRNNSNAAAVDYISDIFLKIRWSSPEWPLSIQRTVVEYCHLILNQATKVDMKQSKELFETWCIKVKHEKFGKLANEILEMIQKIHSIYIDRDRHLMTRGVELR